MEGGLATSSTRISRRKILLALLALQVFALAALAVKKPYLSWYALALPLLPYYLAFELDAERLRRASEGRRLYDWFSQLQVGIVVSNVLASVWFWAR